MPKTDFTQIKFNPKYHTYTYQGQRLTSVTRRVSDLSTPFDRDAKAAAYAAKNGLAVEDVLTAWDAKGKTSRERGSLVHKHIQDILTGQYDPDDPFLAMNELLPEMKAFNTLWTKSLANTINVYQVEWVIGDADLGIAGTVDTVLYNPQTETYHIWDWKTGDHDKFESNYGEFFLSPLDEIPQHNYHKYSFQVSLYRLILERNTDLRLGDSYLVLLGGDGVFRISKAVDFREVLEGVLI